MNRDKSYVIHQRWLNEKQLIIEFFGLEVGRVQCVTNKSLAPQIGSLYDIQWKENKSGLHRLKQAELSGPIYLLQHNYLISLLYLHELMLALMPVGIVYTQIFKQYSKALKDLHTKKTIAHTIRSFEQVLLSDLGYGVDASQLPDHSEGWLRFDTNEGFRYFTHSVPDSFPIACIRRVLNHEYQELDMQDAKRFFHSIIKQLLPNKVWYSKNIYV